MPIKENNLTRRSNTRVDLMSAVCFNHVALNTAPPLTMQVFSLLEARIVCACELRTERELYVFTLECLFCSSSTVPLFDLEKYSAIMTHLKSGPKLPVSVRLE